MSRACAHAFTIQGHERFSPPAVLHKQKRARRRPEKKCGLIWCLVSSIVRKQANPLQIIYRLLAVFCSDFYTGVPSQVWRAEKSLCPKWLKWPCPWGFAATQIIMGTRMACFCGCCDNKKKSVLDGNHGNGSGNVKRQILSAQAGRISTAVYPTFFAFHFWLYRFLLFIQILTLK